MSRANNQAQLVPVGVMLILSSRQNSGSDGIVCAFKQRDEDNDNNNNDTDIVHLFSLHSYSCSLS